MSNLKDLNDIINTTPARLYTQKSYPASEGGGSDYTSHSSIVEEGTSTSNTIGKPTMVNGEIIFNGEPIFNDDGIMMSYGPSSSAKILPGKLGFALEPKLSTSKYITYPSLSMKSNVMSLNKYLFNGLRFVSKYTPYQGLTSNCVNWASLGLWLNGIPNIGLHPYLLHGSLALYNTHIYNIMSYQLSNIK